jgi:alpha-glucuronidase
VYYHKASPEGIGFDRTAAGSNALAQYAPGVQKLYGKPETCPEEFLLWFHHVKWNYQVKSGRTLWDELCQRYYRGAAEVGQMRQTWQAAQAYVDVERFNHVKMLLLIQEKEARWWRDACVLYFQTFAQQPIPTGLEKPGHPLDYYVKQDPKFVPGN